MAVKRVRLDLEYIFKASPTILYTFVTTPECLIRWYCDEVSIQNDHFDFSWSNSSEAAYLEDDIEDERVRFVWEDAEDPEEYLEFKFYKAEITNETIMEITDFCDDDEVVEVTDMWNSLITALKKESGG